MTLLVYNLFVMKDQINKYNWITFTPVNNKDCYDYNTRGAHIVLCQAKFLQKAALTGYVAFNNFQTA